MKIIDLINKINNDEKVPDKVKFENIIFEYSKKQKDYIHEIDAYCSETLLFKVINTHFISDLLETDVEIIEEDKEIEEIPHKTYLELKKGCYNIEKILNDIRLDLKIHQNKINQLIKLLKKNK